MWVVCTKFYSQETNSYDSNWLWKWWNIEFSDYSSLLRKIELGIGTHKLRTVNLTYNLIYYSYHTNITSARSMHFAWFLNDKINRHGIGPGKFDLMIWEKTGGLIFIRIMVWAFDNNKGVNHFALKTLVFTTKVMFSVSWSSFPVTRKGAKLTFLCYF